ncbi:MAG TPA: DUF2958 domain-containing protein [Stellaceae bacterium]|nr:DUF2958 domain-containing protein [Stellaceae bacterium]
MDLMPAEIREKLLANGAAEHETDHVPVVKFFDPSGAATWLITEMMPAEPDILFGLCDLGMGSPELGYVSLAELQSVKGRLGLGIERDLYFAPRYPLSVFAEAARISDRITEADEALARAAASLGRQPLPPEPPPPEAGTPRR